MKFAHPDGGTFEIPDDWWIAAKMRAFIREEDHYRSEVDEDYPSYRPRIVLLAEIAPMRRNLGVALDFGGFDRKRMVSVMSGIAARAVIKPVKIRPLALLSAKYPYELYDCVHRYHASVAAGFTHLPAIVENWGAV